MTTSATTTSETTTDPRAPRRVRRWTAKTPIWVRVALMTASVLVGVLVATVIVGGTGIGVRSDSGGHGSGGGHASGTQMPITDHNGGDHGSNPDRGSGNSHSGEAGHN
jgi:hypothetical protein